MGFRPTPQSRITVRVEGKLTHVFVDTGVHHLVLTKAYGNLSQKKSWVQGAPAKSQCLWTIQITLEFKMSHKFHSLLLITKCPYPLLGRDLLTRVRAQITSNKNGVSIIYREGQPIQILTFQLKNEYKIHQELPTAPQYMNR